MNDPEPVPPITGSELPDATDSRMQDRPIRLGARQLAPGLADLVRDARLLIGWSQRELAARSGTSQATVWRIETAGAARLDVLVVERVLSALGIRASLDLDVRHLADRRRQRDAVHARISGYVARNLARLGWRVETEVPIGEDRPRGWIDLLAFRDADACLFLEETKTEIADLGALQRSLAFYEREAWQVAERLGWRARRLVVALVGLDSQTFQDRLRANRELAASAFPVGHAALAATLALPGVELPKGWAIAAVDPSRRGRRWLQATALHGRRSPATYRSYADAAVRLRSGARRDGRGRPDSGASQLRAGGARSVPETADLSSPPRLHQVDTTPR